MNKLKTLKDYKHFSKEEIASLPISIRAEYEMLLIQVLHNGWYTPNQTEDAFKYAYEMGWKHGQLEKK